MIRKAKQSDSHDIFEMSRRLCKESYPQLAVDVARLSGVLKVALLDDKHFAWVSVNETGEIRGALIALTEDNLWAQRKRSNVVVWTSSVPGDGVALLRAFRNWVKEGRSIKLAGLYIDVDVDPRTLILADRVGFKKHGSAQILFN